jgi:hypothetical protein
MKYGPEDKSEKFRSITIIVDFLELVIEVAFLTKNRIMFVRKNC